MRTEAGATKRRSDGATKGWKGSAFRVRTEGSGFRVQGSVGRNDEGRSPKPERMTKDEVRMTDSLSTQDSALRRHGGTVARRHESVRRHGGTEARRHEGMRRHGGTRGQLTNGPLTRQRTTDNGPLTILRIQHSAPIALQSKIENTRAGAGGPQPDRVPCDGSTRSHLSPDVPAHRGAGHPDCRRHGGILAAHHARNPARRGAAHRALPRRRGDAHQPLRGSRRSGHDPPRRRGQSAAGPGPAQLGAIADVVRVRRPGRHSPPDAGDRLAAHAGHPRARR